MLAVRLRQLRKEAGAPTYRQMAARVHYSPSTLAAAAAGKRLPSREVVAAYVSACGAEPEPWLLDLDHLTAAAKDSDPVTGPPLDQLGAGETVDVDVVGPSFAAVAPRRAWWRRRWPRVTVLSCVAVLVATGALVWKSRDATAPAGAGGPGCPASPAGARWTGTTHPDGVIVRTGPGKDYPPAGPRLVGGCSIALEGYCFGQTVADAWLDTPDDRWFILPDGHYVASAVVFGNPPPDLTAQHCAGGRGAPQLGAVTITGVPGQVTLHVKGRDLPLVGVAALGSGTAWTHSALAPVTDSDEVELTVTPPARTPALTVTACAAAAAPSTSAIVIDLHSAPHTITAVSDPQARHAACRPPDDLTPHQ